MAAAVKRRPKGVVGRCVDEANGDPALALLMVLVGIWAGWIVADGTGVRLADPG